jgi:hypothetical protein
MAKARYDILVSAVYWRSNEHVVVGDPLHAVVQPPVSSRPAPLEAPAPVPAPRDRGEQALAAVNQGRQPMRPLMPTGFEDTEMIEEDVREHLSGTQYGALS